jgi:ribose/xylose/arabinose/galactoside ABC-type transport system permease subunit
MTPPPSTGKRARFRFQREYGLLILFVILFTWFATTVEGFATTANLLDTVLRDQAPFALLAVGMTLVILTRGIDLSVGSIVALAGMAMGLAWKSTQSGFLAIAAALGVGALCGACNGFLITRGRVPPLIVTLATLSVFRGLAYLISGSHSAGGVGGFPPEVRSWAQYNVAGLPVPFWIVVVTLVIAGVYLARTAGGRAVYAVGSNPAAARLSGVPVNLLTMRVYLLSGLLSGLAAVLYAARNDNVKANIGDQYELAAITIVVLGGTSVAGGIGSIGGTALGFCVLEAIRSRINLNNTIVLGPWQTTLPRETHGIIVAVLLIGALLLDAWSRRRAQDAGATPSQTPPVPPPAAEPAAT